MVRSFVLAPLPEFFSAETWFQSVIGAPLGEGAFLADTAPKSLVGYYDRAKQAGFKLHLKAGTKDAQPGTWAWVTPRSTAPQKTTREVK
jgi:hypothetical protein